MASATPANGNTNGTHEDTRDSHGTSARDAKPATYLVIVHPSGRADAETVARFWTEVPALAACTSDGDTVEQAIQRVQAEIARWLQSTHPEGQATNAGLAFDVAIQLAF